MLRSPNRNGRAVVDSAGRKAVRELRHKPYSLATGTGRALADVEPNVLAGPGGTRVARRSSEAGRVNSLPPGPLPSAGLSIKERRVRTGVSSLSTSYTASSVSSLVTSAGSAPRMQIFDEGAQEPSPTRMRPVAGTIRAADGTVSLVHRTTGERVATSASPRRSLSSRRAAEVRRESRASSTRSRGSSSRASRLARSGSSSSSIGTSPLMPSPNDELQRLRAQVQHEAGELDPEVQGVLALARTRALSHVIARPRPRLRRSHSMAAPFNVHANGVRDSPSKLMRSLSLYSPHSQHKRRDLPTPDLDVGAMELSVDVGNSQGGAGGGRTVTPWRAEYLDGPLPTTRNMVRECSGVSADLVAQLLVETQQAPASRELNFLIIDCRYPYEYQHGHIASAVNLWTRSSLIDALIQSPLPANFRLIFHCEFSTQRGPDLCSMLRLADRHVGMEKYGVAFDESHLHYPNCYVLRGGYKEFFGAYPELCTPSAYMTMDDERYKYQLAACRRHRSSSIRERSRSCSDLAAVLAGEPTLFAPAASQPPPLSRNKLATPGRWNHAPRWERENAMPEFASILAQALPDVTEENASVHPLIRRARMELAHALATTPLASRAASAALFAPERALASRASNAASISDSDDDCSTVWVDSQQRAGCGLSGYVSFDDDDEDDDDVCPENSVETADHLVLPPGTGSPRAVPRPISSRRALVRHLSLSAITEDDRDFESPSGLCASPASGVFSSGSQTTISLRGAAERPYKLGRRSRQLLQASVAGCESDIDSDDEDSSSSSSSGPIIFAGTAVSTSNGIVTSASLSTLLGESSAPSSPMVMAPEPRLASSDEAPLFVMDESDE
ncbi:uncharacterized protein AMSG_06271 [Thecamonas trahens ATCC 50062]|uniref:protein-tyrosine-phosphatase n=1 Tax=Thecamonas trahens ATCC 50062 TaxID=461836 RepID=A0A0L0DCJ8_THETB|nr:hypothetical protein AMSG_06271 [Thecamonas trahens ATCC 50062]KNC49960.1 hypothetical protein AMSG_06271 [Thecamonas trahens ATCC 50062]|eukprot:XP_013757434.1 hypothetical protein AMSG_06271 [Thecamonas trahens ATCC 50062]